MTIIRTCFACQMGDHKNHVSGRSLRRRRRPHVIPAFPREMVPVNQTRKECRCTGDCTEQKRQRDEADREYAEQQRVAEIDQAAKLLRRAGYTVIDPAPISQTTAQSSA